MSKLTSDSLKRQTDINEWYYNYRLDTLFVLQLLFLGLSLLVLLTVLSTYRIVPPIFVGYYAGMMFLTVFLVWYFKYSYNSTTRDFYNWDKRKFSSDGNVKPFVTADVRQAMSQIMESNCQR